MMSSFSNALFSIIWLCFAKNPILLKLCLPSLAGQLQRDAFSFQQRKEEGVLPPQAATIVLYQSVGEAWAQGSSHQRPTPRPPTWMDQRWGSHWETRPGAHVVLDEGLTRSRCWFTHLVGSANFCSTWTRICPSEEPQQELPTALICTGRR